MGWATFCAIFRNKSGHPVFNVKNKSFSDTYTYKLCNANAVGSLLNTIKLCWSVLKYTNVDFIEYKSTTLDKKIDYMYLFTLHTY
jgi:hypothetical protein